MHGSYIDLPVTDVESRFDDLIRVEVGQGDERRVFPVFASILTTRSKFFEKALSDGWKEAEDRVVKLPEVDLSVFNLYLHHVLSGDFPVVAKNTPSECLDLNIYLGLSERLQLSRLYILAELLQDTTTKNKTLKAFIASIFKIRQRRFFMPDSQAIRVIYEGTPPESAMRRLLVDSHAAYGKSDYISSHVFEEWPKEFLYEFAVRVLADRAAPSVHAIHKARNDGGLVDIETEEEKTT
jgi:hypothetical protein